MNAKHMVNFSRDEVSAGRTDWDRLRALTDDAVEQAAAEDPDNPPVPAHVLAKAELVRPEDRAGVPVSIRLDPDLLAFFKAGGPGYQERINAALREYVDHAHAPQRRLAGG